jgi:hypothetical protein
VEMEVALDARAGDLAKIEADVEPLRFHDGGEGVLAATKQFHQVGEFFVGQAVEIGGLLVGDDHQMPAGVGIFVQHGEAGAVARDDEIGVVVAGLRDLRKDGGVRGGGFWGENVLNPPGRVERFHWGMVAGGGGDVKARKDQNIQHPMKKKEF